MAIKRRTEKAPADGTPKRPLIGALRMYSQVFSCHFLRRLALRLDLLSNRTAIDTWQAPNISDRSEAFGDR